MNKHLRQTRRALAAFGNKARGVAQGAVALGTAGMTSLALATPTGLGDTAATTITSSKSQVDVVQSAVLGIVVLFLIFGFIRRSMGK